MKMPIPSAVISVPKVKEVCIKSADWVEKYFTGSCLAERKTFSTPDLINNMHAAINSICENPKLPV